jgi:hypothetical protein
MYPLTSGTCISIESVAWKLLHICIVFSYYSQIQVDNIQGLFLPHLRLFCGPKKYTNPVIHELPFSYLRFL